MFFDILDSMLNELGSWNQYPVFPIAVLPGAVAEAVEASRT